MTEPKRFTRTRFLLRTKKIKLALFLLVLYSMIYASLFLYSKRIRYHCETIPQNVTIYNNVLEKLIGQSQPVYKLIRIFKNLQEANYVVIVGTNGVGKTTIVQTIMRHFQWPENMFVLNPVELFNFNIHRVIGQRECGFNLVVIDNLKVSHVDSFRNFSLSIYEKSTNTIVLAVFDIEVYTVKQSEEKDFQLNRNIINHLRERLTNDLIELNLIEFKLMRDEDIRKCIHKEMTDRGMQTNRQIIEAMFEYIDKFSGCKHVAELIEKNTKNSVWEY